MREITSRTSYPVLASSGTTSLSRGSTIWLSSGSACGGSSLLLEGRNESSHGPANPPESHHQVARELGVHFQEIGAVHDEGNHVAHVVPGLGLERHHLVEARFHHAAFVGFGVRRG